MKVDIKLAYADKNGLHKVEKKKPVEVEATPEVKTTKKSKKKE